MPELAVAGGTATSQAIRLMSGELSAEQMPQRGLPPVCILIPDGYCTDPASEYDAAIAELLKQPLGERERFCGSLAWQEQGGSPSDSCKGNASKSE